VALAEEIAEKEAVLKKLKSNTKKESLISSLLFYFFCLKDINMRMQIFLNARLLESLLSQYSLHLPHNSIQRIF
jgi:hypothetical protein